MKKFAEEILTWVISPTARGDPDCMKAPWNSPSGFPPFTNMWIDVETAPALWPQLKDVSRLWVKEPLHLHRHLPRIATEFADILLYPIKCQTLCDEKCFNINYVDCSNTHDPEARDCPLWRLWLLDQPRTRVLERHEFVWNAIERIDVTRERTWKARNKNEYRPKLQWSTWVMLTDSWDWHRSQAAEARLSDSLW